MSEAMEKGIFYVIGVGPGDPELLTIKGAKKLEDCPVWLAPKAKSNGKSTALTIAEATVSLEGKEVITHHFPMKQVCRTKEPSQELLVAWEQAATLVVEKLNSGKNVAFPTLGDPAIYSTAFYVCEALSKCGADVRVEIIPGVSAIGASAAAAKLPLCLGDEHLVVIPATFEDEKIREILRICDSVAFMKVNSVLPKLVDILDEFSLVEKAVLVEKTSLTEQRIWTDIREAVNQNVHYFSTMIVRKT